MTTLDCPVCPEAILLPRGASMYCPDCRGAWNPHVPENLGPPLRDWRKRDRPCAECREPMEPHELDGLRVECCALHGIWIDIDKLGLAHDPAVVHRNEVLRTVAAYGLLAALVGLELLGLFVL